ncbi:hypothetical protein EYF80_029390 [Liparis tanakae]|uniref:Uncharacterized protein n=1 Tax=Liparis tanakae TaxID=230148 RepID=A0A4Z2H462_9TELE|nr:hypothetical protein EYF80_029390 [Liparis tanakae]
MSRLDCGPRPGGIIQKELREKSEDGDMMDEGSGGEEMKGCAPLQQEEVGLEGEHISDIPKNKSKRSDEAREEKCRKRLIRDAVQTQRTGGWTLLADILKLTVDRREAVGVTGRDTNTTKHAWLLKRHAPL